MCVRPPLYHAVLSPPFVITEPSVLQINQRGIKIVFKEAMLCYRCLLAVRFHLGFVRFRNTFWFGLDLLHYFREFGYVHYTGAQCHQRYSLKLTHR